VSAVLGFTLLSNRLRVAYRTPLTGCAFDDGTGGASGLKRWCERLGMPATLLEVPLEEAPDSLDAPTGNVVITMGDGPWSPSDEALEARSARRIRDWVNAGNALIVVASRRDELPEEIQKQFLDIHSSEELQAPSRTAEKIERWMSQSVELRPETVDLSVDGKERLRVTANGPRWSPSSEKRSQEDLPPLKDSQESEGKQSKGKPHPWQIAGDAQGGVLFRIPIGAGSCYLLLDPYAWSNAGLDAGENPLVLAKILDRELKGGQVVIDEHRHGHGRPESFLSFLLSLPGASSFLWLALAWALLYYYARNVRLRPAERFEEHERRTAREYIEAVAQLHERARAAPLAVEAVAGRLRQLARHSPEHTVAIETILREADAYVASENRPARPGDAVRLVTKLVQLRKQFYGSRSIS